MSLKQSIAFPLNQLDSHSWDLESEISSESVIIGLGVDKIFIYYVKKNNDVQKPEFRLPVMIFSSLSIPIGLFWYGWSAHEHVHFVVPIIVTSFIGFGMISVMV